MPDFAALNIAYGEAHNWETTIPAGVPTYVLLQLCLLPADCFRSESYIARHEIVALHSAGEEGNVQLYPTCHVRLLSGGLAYADV